MNKSRKVIVLSILTLVMFFHSVVFADTMAIPTSAKVVVNGELTSFEAYSIGGSNYFKLKDIAFVVNGSDKQFAVNWDGTKKVINLVSDAPYTPVGSEMSVGDGKNKKAVLNTSKIYKDGNPIELTAYTIGGYNFFKLADLAQAFNIDLSWDGLTKTIKIDTVNVEDTTPTIETEDYKYWGEVKEGLPHGQGTYIFPDGTKYVGESLNSEFSGQGTITYSNGDKYVGKWLHDKRSGQGTYTCSNGNIYDGEWLNGELNGQGKVTYSNGGKYVGNWLNDEFSGQGTLTMSNGDKYVGEFMNDTFNGQGTLTMSNGDKYVGEFMNGDFSGQGTYTWPDGYKYVGEFLNGEFSGQGAEYDNTGKKICEGIYQFGEFIQ